MKSAFQAALLGLGILVPPAALARSVTTDEVCAPRGLTEITVTRAEHDALATYQLGEPVSCLKLGDRGDVRKLTWQLQTEGAALSDDGNTVHFASPRKDFAVRLRAFSRDGQMDRVYSPLIAFGDGSAVAVYTSYLRPAFAQRGVFMAFDGFAPTAPERQAGPQRIGNEQNYIVVGQPVLERRGKVLAAIDQSMPRWLLDKVMNSISRGESALRRVAPSPHPLSYLITYTGQGETGATWRGDTLDKLVRLNFMGAGWLHEKPGTEEQIDQFVLHELFHTASGPALDPRLPGAMTLSEGAAEAAAMAIRARASASAAASMPAAIDDAVARCGDIPGKTLAEKEQKSQRNTPYVCGMALQFMVAAAARRDPLDVWEALLRKSAPSTAGWSMLLAAGAEKGESNRAALAILDQVTSSRLTWDSGIARLAEAGLLRRRTDGELDGEGYAPHYLRSAVFHLLGASCRKSYGFHSLRPVYVLDAPEGSCGAIPDKFRLTALNGVPLDGAARKAHRELTRRCLAGEPVEMLDDSGQRVALTCTKAPAEIVLYTLSGH